MISVNNLDLGYEQCSNIHRLANESGANLINNLASTIGSLKQHWKGSDATEHINNIIIVHDALVALVTDAVAVTSTAGKSIVAMQQVRSANGGGGLVGDELSNAAPSATTIAKADATTEYFVDPASTADYAALQQECKDYNTFITNFKSEKDNLMNNWTDGANRAEAVARFAEFEQNSETYNKYLTAAEENLGTAVSNISQIME